MINMKTFYSNLLKIGTKSRKKHGIYYIGYIITILKIDDYENMYSAKPLYLIVNTIDRHNEEKNGNKYLTFACFCRR